MHWENWNSIQNLGAKNFICGFCGREVGAHKGYFHQEVAATIYICPACSYPTFFYDSVQYPGPLMGRNITGLPEDIKSIYTEIREVTKNGNYTASILLGRKLIMHLAVDVAGAKEGEKFVSYVDSLQKANYIPPGSEKWVKLVKDLGNEKNHEIKIASSIEAERILKFIEILLTFVYEYGKEMSEVVEE